MSNNGERKIQRRIEPQIPAPNPGSVEVVQGNVPLLTVKLLDSINQNLVAIRAALEKQNG